MYTSHIRKTASSLRLFLSCGFVSCRMERQTLAHCHTGNVTHTKNTSKTDQSLRIHVAVHKQKHRTRSPLGNKTLSRSCFFVSPLVQPRTRASQAVLNAYQILQTIPRLPDVQTRSQIGRAHV